MWKDAQEFLLKDKFIGPPVSKWGNCTLAPTKQELYFEDLVDAICSQQLSGKAAKTIFERVKTLVGGSFKPEAILAIEDKKLRDQGLSWSKVNYVKDLAQKVQNGTLNLEELLVLTDEQIIKVLVGVKGIGRWTAEMFLMFSLARPDVFPVDDLGIQKGFEKAVGKRFNKTKSAEFAEKHWKPYRSVASWYLWRSLDI